MQVAICRGYSESSRYNGSKDYSVVERRDESMLIILYLAVS